MELLQDSFVRMDSRAHGEHFSGSIQQVRSNGLGVAEVRATGHEVQRTKHHIAASASDVVFVNIQVSGQGTVQQFGDEVPIRPFDIGLVDTTAPYRISHAADFALVSVELPRPIIGASVRGERRVALSRTSGGRALSSLLLDVARLCVGTARTPATPPIASLVELIRYALELETKPEDVRTTSVRTELVLSYIDRHFAIAGLSAQSIAGALGFSVRYVHKVLEPTGRSLSEHVNAKRLDAARTLLLADTPSESRRVSAIAFECGFGDLSRFNRLYRTVYDETPSETLRRTSGD